MIYKVIDLKAANKMGAIYVLIHFWKTRKQMEDGEPPLLMNDFYMQLRDEHTRIVTEEVNGEVYVTTESGIRRRMHPKLVEDPNDLFVRETTKANVPVEIRKAVMRYWHRAKARGETGRRTWPVKTRPKLTASDPAGILNLPDVKDLKGKDFEAISV